MNREGGKPAGDAAPATGDVPTVDAHAHIFTRTMPLVPNPRHRPAYDFTVEDYLDVLDRFGIHYGVIAAASPWGDYNAYTVDSVGKHPRLRGTVILDPDADYDFERMNAAGIVGVRLPFLGLPEVPDIASAGYRRLFRTIAGLGWHVHLHVEGVRIPRLLSVLEDAGPDLVIDHLGRPGPEDRTGDPGFQAIVAAVGRGRTWVKTSAAYRIGPSAEYWLRAFLDAVDPTRLLWASDCPFVGHEEEVSYGDTIDWFAGRIGDAGLRKRIFGENAYGFYFRAG